MKRPNWDLGNCHSLMAAILLAFLVAIPSPVWSQLQPSDFLKRFPTTPQTRVRINETLPLVAILVEFSDQPRQYQKAKIHQMLFGPAPSVVDYFSWVSSGKFRFDQAGAGTLGWFTAPRTQAAYTAMEDGSSVRRTDSIMVAKQALAKLNLTSIDRNHDKIITASELTIVLIWASPGKPDDGAAARFPKPHKLNIGNGFSLDMRLLAIYEPRIREFSPAVLSPATVAHEIAHVAFGLGDQYETGRPNDKSTEALCGFSLMSNDQALKSTSGVPILDAWALLQLGWLDAKVAYAAAGCYQLRAVEHHHEAIIVPIYGRGTTEYFIVENRFPQGTYNAGFAPGAQGIDKGIAVWHIDETLKNNKIIDHRRAIRLLRATGPVPAITCTAAKQGKAFFDSSDPLTAYPLTNGSSPRNTRKRDGSRTGIEISSIPSPAIDSRVFIANPYRTITSKRARINNELRPLERQVRNLQHLNQQLRRQIQIGDLPERYRTVINRNNDKIAALHGKIEPMRSKLKAVERETVAEFSALPVRNGCP